MIWRVCLITLLCRNSKNGALNLITSIVVSAFNSFPMDIEEDTGTLEILKKKYIMSGRGKGGKSKVKYVLIYTENLSTCYFILIVTVKHLNYFSFSYRVRPSLGLLVQDFNFPLVGFTVYFAKGTTQNVLVLVLQFIFQQ